LVQDRSRRAARFIEVELRQVRLNLGGRPVLRGIDWRICPGQRWVLCGPNGSGKTQLLKLLAGDVWPSPVGGGTRSFRYGGEIFTDPYGIKDEVAYLGPERQDRYEHYEWNHRVQLVVATGLQRTDIPLAPPDPADRRRITRLLAGLGIASLSRRRFLTLSYGERRLVLLARALAWRPKLLLLDELFNGLDPVNHARAARCLQRLSRSALPWVLSTHRAQDAPAAATHWCELEAGRITAQGRLSAASGRLRARVAAPAALKSARSSVTSRTHAPGPKPRHALALITLRRARVWREGNVVLRDISLEIRRGDCWLVHGANGSGKSTLMQALYGDLGVARGGSLLRAGMEPGVPLQVFQRRVGLIAPELQAIYPRDLTAVEVVVSGLGASLGLNMAASALELRLARRALRRLGAASLAARTVRTLSYGQLRRVLFARAIVHAPDILLLDEPYAGLDLRQRTAMRRMIERLMSGGVTAVMATHHVDEWPRQSTHELELARGRVVYCGPVRSPTVPGVQRAS